MKLGNMKVTRRDGGVIVVQEFMKDEEGCFVSKPGSDTIEGRYLHALAGVVIDAQAQVDKLVNAAQVLVKALNLGDGYEETLALREALRPFTEASGQ